ncbi:MAG: hypothetical protein ACYC1M_17990 [Armatimonadota bacterium]
MSRNVFEWVIKPSHLPNNKQQVYGLRFRDINVSAIDQPSLLKQSGCRISRPYRVKPCSLLQQAWLVNSHVL